MLLCPTVITELERALARARDREIGGVLLQDSAGSQRIRLAPNLLEEPGALEVPGWWLRRMLERRDASGLRPIAFFHSHLSTLDLSDEDRVAMRAAPLPWIILQLDAGVLRWIAPHM